VLYWPITGKPEIITGGSSVITDRCEKLLIPYCIPVINITGIR
jgi:hypothetical protein